MIGATNYIGKLDSAILRTGRLDSVIYLGMPDETAILDILKKSLKKSQLQCVWCLPQDACVCVCVCLCCG